MNAVGALAMAIVAVSAPTASQVTNDRANDLVGAWSCETSAGTTATMTYTRKDDGSIEMRYTDNDVDSTPAQFDETYHFITPDRYWTWTATWQGHPDFKEAATAGMWTAQKWFFDGTLTRRPRPHDTDTHRIRMVYTWISNTSFERAFEIYDGSVWRTSSSSVCRRTLT